MGGFVGATYTLVQGERVADICRVLFFMSVLIILVFLYENMQKYSKANPKFEYIIFQRLRNNYGFLNFIICKVYFATVETKIIAKLLTEQYLSAIAQ
jgi:hypothetical protein